MDIVHSVFIEEKMPTLTLAAYIFSRRRRLANLDYPGIIPSYPTFLAHSDNAFPVGLTKFSRKTLETFLQIERPAEHDGLPEDDNFETVGEFYEAIEEALQRLAGEMARPGCSAATERGRSTTLSTAAALGRIIAVTDLASALRALEEIVEQGEALEYQEIWDASAHVPPRAGGSHALLPLQRALRRPPLHARRHAPVGSHRRAGRGRLGRRLADAVEPTHRRLSRWQPDPRTDGGVDHAYTAVLHLLHETFNGSPGLLAVATGLMYASRPTR